MADDLNNVPPWRRGRPETIIVHDRFDRPVAVDAATGKRIQPDDPSRPECLSCNRRFIPKLRKQRICNRCRKKPEFRGLAAL
ncbi:MAG: hypothetical protein P4L66_08120 [Acetobacteraceae bacterium]|nr:hypothetical protein [Acetobacteraceae bacterium]